MKILQNGLENRLKILLGVLFISLLIVGCSPDEVPEMGKKNIPITLYIR